MTISPDAPPEKSPNCADHLVSRIRGQAEVIGRVAAVLQRAELGLTKPGRPKASFLFLGPTGVGKTELTLCFSEYLLGSGSVHRFDMSEFQNQNSVGLLLGEHLGERGLLGSALDKRQICTLLFDEIEKAHPRVLDLFLQMLDAARVTLADGNTLDLSGCYIVMTSNIGSAEIMGLHHSAYATMERHVLTRAQQSLRPELYARSDGKAGVQPSDVRGASRGRPAASGGGNRILRRARAPDRCGRGRAQLSGSGRIPPTARRAPPARRGGTHDWRRGGD